MADIQYFSGVKTTSASILIAANHMRAWGWLFATLAIFAGVGGAYLVCQLVDWSAPIGQSDTLQAATILLAVILGLESTLCLLAWRCAQTRQRLLRRDPAALDWAIYGFSALFMFVFLAFAVSTMALVLSVLDGLIVWVAYLIATVFMVIVFALGWTWLMLQHARKALSLTHNQ